MPRSEAYVEQVGGSAEPPAAAGGRDLPWRIRDAEDNELLALSSWRLAVDTAEALYPDNARSVVHARTGERWQRLPGGGAWEKIDASAPLPLIQVVDLETTGFHDAPDEHGAHMPVELGGCPLYGRFDLVGDPDFADAAVGRPWSAPVAPGRPVPPEASAIHHIVAADLGAAPDWRTEAVWRLRSALPAPPVALAAHNAKFERHWLTPELVGEPPWLCTWKCALRAWPEAPGHGNQVLRYWLSPPGLDRDAAMPAHRAGPDAYVTAFLLRELLRLHPLATLLQWSEEPAVLIRVPFGKRPEEGGWRGCKWTEVDEGLLWWTAERDFSDDIRHTVKLELARRAALSPDLAEDDTEDAEAMP